MSSKEDTSSAFWRFRCHRSKLVSRVFLIIREAMALFLGSIPKRNRKEELVIMSFDTYLRKACK